MAQTFKVVSKEQRSAPAVRKHRTRLVVSAISKTPITVTPLDTSKKPRETAGEVPAAAAQTPAPPGRARGRPRKATVAPAAAEKGPKPAKLKRARPHRVGHARLLEAASQVSTSGLAGGKVPLAASRIVEQLTSLLGRASVAAFRGKREKPLLTLSKLEEQAIQEALALFQLKVSLQRGGEVRRLRVS